MKCMCLLLQWTLINLQYSTYWLLVVITCWSYYEHHVQLRGNLITVHKAVKPATSSSKEAVLVSRNSKQCASFSNTMTYNLLTSPVTAFVECRRFVIIQYRHPRSLVNQSPSPETWWCGMWHSQRREAGLGSQKTPGMADLTSHTRTRHLHTTGDAIRVCLDIIMPLLWVTSPLLPRVTKATQAKNWLCSRHTYTLPAKDVHRRAEAILPFP